MVAENDEIHIGWPLGLGILNMRLRIVESLPGATLTPSASFSSFSSSSLDTESTASFFQDKSVSLAHLIGIRPGERGQLYYTNTLKCEEREKKLRKGCSGATKEQEVDMSRGICIPLLLDTLKRITTSKSKKSSRN